MVRAKLDVYYTFKIMSPLEVDMRSMDFLVHCLKWEEFGDQPITTYKIMPGNPSAVGGCSCPAWTSNCKHRKVLDEATKDGKIQELHKWRWSERDGWQATEDIDPEAMMKNLGLDGPIEIG